MFRVRVRGYSVYRFIESLGFTFLGGAFKVKYSERLTQACSGQVSLPWTGSMILQDCTPNREVPNPKPET